MGSSAHTAAINAVLAAHAEEFRQEVLDDLPDAVKALGPLIELEPQVEDIERWLVFQGSDGKPQYLALAPLTIFELKERYPDEIAW